MAQDTSALWKALLETPGTRAEYKFDIAGTEYGPEAVIAHSVDRSLFDEFGIGGCAAAKLTLTLLAEDVPRGAEIRRYVRLVNGEQASEWLPKGVFFASRRTQEDGVWDIEAYDALRRAEQVWTPGQGLRFPLSMPAAVEELRRILGCELDERTALEPAYTVDYPADYTVREELAYIAAAHGGNWTVTDQGKLLLAPLWSAPPETWYLVDGRGRAITFGGDRICLRS